MKKRATLCRLLLLLSLSTVWSNAQAQYIPIDTNFGTWLSNNNYYSCLIGSAATGWKLDTNCTAIRTATSVSCDGNNIRSLNGIQYFTSLSQLSCQSNSLTSLPPLPATLTYLACSTNQLDSLPPLPPLLTYLTADNNSFTSVPALPSGIDYLTFDNDPITSLPALPSALSYLSCFNTYLHTLPALPAGLQELTCEYNDLLSLPELPASLGILNCSYNPNLSCLPRLPLNMSLLYIGNTNIQCVPNRIAVSSYDVNPDSLPLCTPGTGCDFYYNIIGDAHQDTSAGCQQDSIHPGSEMNHVKVQVSNNGVVLQQFYTTLGLDGTGFTFDADSFGSYQLSIDTMGLPFAVACPASGVRSVVLSAADTTAYRQSFGLSCVPGFDLAASYIYAQNFRPSLTSTVSCGAGDLAALYGASCVNGQGGEVKLILGGPVHYVSPLAGALTPVLVGDTLIWTVADFGQTDYSTSFNVVLGADSSAQIGQQICLTLIVDPISGDRNPANNILSQCFVVKSSFDPNLKTAYPVTFTEQSDWITYTIHFQNTGNDTALTVVIRDTLSTYLLPETFQYLASSHEAVIQLFGNAMVFTFPRINLPDSATNPALSQGWIAYKVKNRANLPATAQILNNASVYFDLNPAVVTNTTVNTLDTTTSLGITPISAASNLRLYPNPNKGTFTLQTTNGMNQYYTITDMMGNIIAYSPITSENQIIQMQEVAGGVYTLVVTDAMPVRFVIVK